MVSRYTRLRLRRRLRTHRKEVEQAADQAEKQFDRHIVRRWQNLRGVRRFVVGWLVLILLLISGVLMQNRSLGAYYLEEAPAPGGVFTEGVVGELTNMNPIFAINTVDTTTAKLLFSSLLAYDQENQLEGDLALEWSVSEDGTIYTVTLRQDAYWHDGEQFTAEDVVFTYEAIQHPDTRSPLNQSWQDIVVQAKDDFTVTFALPNRFTPFPHSLTTGIIPAHVFTNVLPSQMRSNDFNTLEPIGTGPFQFRDIIEDETDTQIVMRPHELYHRGEPLLDRFIVRAFDDHEIMIEAFVDGELTGMAGVRTFDQLLLPENGAYVWRDVPLESIVFIFLKTSDPVLTSREVRAALTHATDREALITLLDHRFAPAETALLRNQLGYDPRFDQLPFDPAQANALLDQAGWVVAPDGIRVKGDQQLIVKMVTLSSDEYPQLAQKLQEQWAQVGIRLEVELVDENILQQSFIVPHSYQSLLFGVTIGVDPDVFVYWHSSQRGIGGFNLSEYENSEVDDALEAGRTRSDPALRAAKYHSFLEQWQTDAPAIALYQPGFGYVQATQVKGFEQQRLATPTDRFNSVQQWTVNTEAQKKRY